MTWDVVGSGDQPPLIAIHSWPEEVANYEALVREWDDRSIYMILAPHESSAPQLRRVDDWVDTQLAVLRELPVAPPYRLIGWSFAGILALEIARKLQAEGHEVAYVGMIDSWRTRRKPRSLREAFWTVLGDAALINDPHERNAHIHRSTRRYLGQVRRRIRARIWRGARSFGLLKTRVRPRSMESVEPLKRAIWTSNLNYAGDSVDFPVALFTSSRSVNQTHDRTLGWAAWLRGGFQLHPLTGRHSTLFDQDCVAHNAEILRNSIEAETLMRRDQPNVTSSSPQ